MTTDNEAYMSPSSSPVSHKSGVRRVNKLPLLITIAGLFAFVLVIMWVAYKRGINQADTIKKEDDSVSQKVTSSFDLAKSVLSEEKPLGFVEPLKPTPPIAEATQPLLPEQPRVAPAATLQPLATEHAPVVDPSIEHIKQVKQQQFEDAVKAQTEVKNDAVLLSSPSGDSVEAKLAAVRRMMLDNNGKAQNADQAYQAKLEAIKNTLYPDNKSGNANTSQANTAPSRANDIATFDNQEGGNRWNLGANVEAPSSPFMIRAGGVIPGVMISGINSDLPGVISAQVSQDVYDTAKGNTKLIPQGTKLLGAYSSQIIFGQEAVLVAWQRITLPDGKVLDLGAMPGSDSAGYAGFRDQVNHHYLRTFSSALLMSAIVGGVALSQNNNQNSGGIGFQQNSSTTLSQVLGQQLGQVTAQMIAKNLNISPTIDIRPGYTFNVIVTKDIVFPNAYQAFDY